MPKVTEEMMNSDSKAISMKMPEKLHNHLKSQAALRGTTKDKFLVELIKIGYEHYNN